MATLLDEFWTITSALNDAGIEYAVCGGWAMAVHGLPRATMDIDLLVPGRMLRGCFQLSSPSGLIYET